MQRGEEREHEAEGAGDHEGRPVEPRVEERAASRPRRRAAAAAAGARHVARDQLRARRGGDRLRRRPRRCRRAPPRRRRRAPAPRAARRRAAARRRSRSKSGGMTRPAPISPADERALDRLARRERARHGRPRSPPSSATRRRLARRAARVEHAELQVLDLGREDEAEGEQRDERHRDQDASVNGSRSVARTSRRTSVRRRRALTARRRRRAAAAPSRTRRRKTSVIAGCSMRTLAALSGPSTRASSASSAARQARARAPPGDRPAPRPRSRPAPSSASTRSRARGRQARLDPVAARVARAQLLGRRVGDQPAGVDEGDPVAVVDLLEEVRGDEDRDARRRPRPGSAPRRGRGSATSTPAVGSSRKSTRGACSVASARPARWRTPAGRFSGRSRSASREREALAQRAPAPLELGGRRARRGRRRTRRSRAARAPGRGSPSGPCSRCGRARGAGARMTSMPSTSIAPAVGVSSPISMRIVVLLPEPLAPRKAKIDAAARRRCRGRRRR